MGGFFQELAKTLAERWFSLLVLPGAFFLGAVWLAATLGHVDAWDVALLARRTEEAAAVAAAPGGAQALLAVAVLAGAAGVGFVVQALAGGCGSGCGRVVGSLPRRPRGGTSAGTG